LKGGDGKVVIFTKPLKLLGRGNSWFVFSMVSETSTDTMYLQRVLISNGEILWSQIIRRVFSIGNTDVGYAACSAYDIDGIWVQVKDEILKFDMTSEDPVTESESEGSYFRCMVEAASDDISGFWGLGDDFIKFYAHSDPIGGYIEPQIVVQNSQYNTEYLSDIYCGAVDDYNNLWAVSVAQNRIVRVNFQKKEIDFDVTVSGVVGVVPHPTDGSAYILTVTPASEDVYYISTTRHPYIADPVHMCKVSGFNSYEFKYGVSFAGYIFNFPVPVSSTNPVWGKEGLEWKPYPSGKAGLPSGRFKQFRLTLQRGDSAFPSPAIQKFRVPKPLLLERIPWNSFLPIYLKASVSPNAQNGLRDFDILIWWSQE
jgi:hypothetical protein